MARPHVTRAPRRGAYVAVAACLILSGCPSPGPRGRIVFIVVDTLRADVLRPYGGTADTPAIERLARSGQALGDAVASFHQTPMSMSAIFTGLAPSIETLDPNRPLEMTGRTSCGLSRLRGPLDWHNCVPRSVRTLGELMKEAGYWTIGVTSNGLLFRPFGIEAGFDQWAEVGGGFLVPEKAHPEERLRLFKTRNWRQVNQSVADLIEHRGSDDFFLYVHYMDVHDYMDSLDLRGRYLEQVAAVDQGIQDLLSLLERKNLWDGTVVVLTADHGERLGENHFVKGRWSHEGNPSFEEVLKIPLIISPARAQPPRGITRTQDIYYLLADLAGIKVPPPSDLEPGEVFLTEEGWRTYRGNRWKLFLERKGGGTRLVDLQADPGERVDVAREHADQVKVMKARVEILSKQLAAHEGARDRLTREDEDRLRALGYVGSQDRTDGAPVAETPRSENGPARP
jgi:arylsulfatase A-like enzyme